MHEEFLRRAISLAAENVELGRGGPFGAVIVMDGEVVAEGANHVTAQNDPTAHAEVEAIREACRRLGRHDLRGGVIYASCEPCPMCLSAIYWARLDSLYYAASKDDASAAGFDDSFL
ncbi:MAG: nucleoside deaminase, partial [Acidobacteria bacterium]|nr:nucleoside deaminase [Acidobacteriota bacterium]